MPQADHPNVPVVEWVEVDPNEPTEEPMPPCEVGFAGHEWTLSIEWGQVSLSSGCESCDLLLDHEYLMLPDIKGRLSIGEDHPNLGGWHGMTRCDCNWWWEFTPTAHSDDRGSNAPG